MYGFYFVKQCLQSKLYQTFIVLRLEMTLNNLFPPIFFKLRWILFLFDGFVNSRFLLAKAKLMIYQFFLQ